MTTKILHESAEECPAEGVLKSIMGKWKPQILHLAVAKPVRFNSLLRDLPNANKQSVASALKELEEAGFLTKTVIREKPLHIEYSLSEKGKSMLPIFELGSSLAKE